VTITLEISDATMKAICIGPIGLASVVPNWNGAVAVIWKSSDADVTHMRMRTKKARNETPSRLPDAAAAILAWSAIFGTESDTTADLGVYLSVRERTHTWGRNRIDY
jgi:hypothetical protein